MARRKNTRFIDPRYFMDEKMERLDEGTSLSAALGGAKELEVAKQGTDIEVQQSKVLKPAIAALDKLRGYVEILQRVPYRSPFSSATNILELMMEEIAREIKTVNKNNIESMIAIARNISDDALNWKYKKNQPAAQKLYHLKERTESFDVSVALGGLKRLAQSDYFITAAEQSADENEQFLSIISDLHTVSKWITNQGKRYEETFLSGKFKPGVLS
tara:strand:- start:353 stop:1000 length:648 start_codon:yes stop_codon:yes gene_type:complete